MRRRYHRDSLGPAMSRGELIAGFCYLPVYLIGLSLLLTLLLNLLGLPYTDAQFNTAFYIINFIMVALLFHRFLADSLRAVGGRFWDTVQAIILGYVLYWVLNWLAAMVLNFLHPGTVNPNQSSIDAILQTDFYLFAACTVLLVPLVEETMFRGLFFSNLYPKSRILAYAVSGLLFCLLHVYSYIGSLPFLDLFFSFLAYAAPAVALGWTYERAGTIWAPILLHGCINLVNSGLLEKLFFLP